MGFSEMIKDEVLGPIDNEIYKSYANDIHESGNHLLKLINEILDLSRIEAGRYELSEKVLDFSEIAQERIKFLRLDAQTKKLRIITDFKPDMPCVFADERALRQICLNLISNAIKFTPESGMVAVRTGLLPGGEAFLSVRDNGPGIPEDEIPRVIERLRARFARAQNARLRRNRPRPSDRDRACRIAWRQVRIAQQTWDRHGSFSDFAEGPRRPKCAYASAAQGGRECDAVSDAGRRINPDGLRKIVRCPEASEFAVCERREYAGDGGAVTRAAFEHGVQAFHERSVWLTRHWIAADIPERRSLIWDLNKLNRLSFYDPGSRFLASRMTKCGASRSRWPDDRSLPGSGG